MPRASTRRLLWRALLAALALLWGVVSSVRAQQPACFNERASQNTAQQGANQGSFRPDVSSDGRYVVFESMATNLDPWDTQPQFDIFVRDFASGTTQRISTPSTGVTPNGDSRSPSISADGQRVVFESAANNLVSGDTNGKVDLFVWTRSTGQLARVSVASNGAAADADCEKARLSGDGRFVVFESRAGNLDPAKTDSRRDIFVRDLLLGTTRCASLNQFGQPGDRDSFHGSISANGNRVAFESESTNMLFWDTNHHNDVYVRDFAANSIARASTTWNGLEGNGGSMRPSISPDGLFVAFESQASNLVNGDTNYQNDIFLRDLAGGFTHRVSISSTGAQGNMRSFEPQFSGNGRYVCFMSEATTMVPGDTNNFTDVFVRDLYAYQTLRVSRGRMTSQVQNHCRNARINSTGRFVVFENDANNLVLSDFNGCSDVFRSDWLADTGNETVSYCEAKTNSLGCLPTISAAGVASLTQSSGFSVRASNVLNQKNGMLVYSITGTASKPFFGGMLCLLAPIVRTPIQHSGGSPVGANCTGVLMFDFNRYMAGGYGPQPPGPLLVPGTTVHCQWYSRDPGFPTPDNISLSNALRFVVQP
ncbi:MAG: calcium-binding protein [Planctomycetes bacterium]|nr:calcium-binding protein [Planctomycetota bacterium]